jgi:hypothetical protein
MSSTGKPARLALAALVALVSGAAAQEPATSRTEREIRFAIEVPAIPSAQCEASTSTSYHQRNTVARLTSTITAEGCAAAGGNFTVAVRVRDESGAQQTLEFDETWQRTDDQDVRLTSDYPIGENVELLSVRVRGMTCTCAAAPPGVAEN